MKTARFLRIALGLTRCKEEVATFPDPVPLTEENVSFFCQMNVLEHGVPKARIHLEGQPAPLFFAEVRDAIAYLKSPERDACVLGTYVSDMGVATGWDTPRQDNWVSAETSLFVIEADVAGGMGAPEIVPFISERADVDFTARYGGRIVDLASIPDAAVLGPDNPDFILEVPK
jgi:copper chaperone NosL